MMNEQAKKDLLMLKRRIYHEAGHAVMGIAVGYKVTKVTIEPTPEEAEYAEGYTSYDGWCRDGLSDHDKLVGNTVMLLSGMIAEVIKFGLSVEEVCKTGAIDLEEIDLREVVSEEEFSLFLEFIRTRLLERWNFVEAVALSLMERGELSGDELVNILNEVQEKEGSDQ